MINFKKLLILGFIFSSVSNGCRDKTSLNIVFRSHSGRADLTHLLVLVLKLQSGRFKAVYNCHTTALVKDPWTQTSVNPALSTACALRQHRPSSHKGRASRLSDLLGWRHWWLTSGWRCAHNRARRPGWVSPRHRCYPPAEEGKRVLAQARISELDTQLQSEKELVRCFSPGFKNMLLPQLE